MMRGAAVGAVCCMSCRTITEMRPHFIPCYILASSTLGRSSLDSHVPWYCCALQLVQGFYFGQTHASFSTAVCFIALLSVRMVLRGSALPSQPEATWSPAHEEPALELIISALHLLLHPHPSPPSTLPSHTPTLHLLFPHSLHLSILSSVTYLSLIPLSLPSAGVPADPPLASPTAGRLPVGPQLPAAAGEGNLDMRPLCR